MGVGSEGREGGREMFVHVGVHECHMYGHVHVNEVGGVPGP